jgi:serine/threonine protein kinase
LIEELGEGGAATVYRARDTATGRYCAIKILRSDGAADDMRERFAREGQVLTRLNHANLVVIDAVGRDGDRDYLVMELLEGGSLQDRIERDGRMTSDQVLAILDGLLAGLEEVHRHQIVHRDVKPGNLLLTSEGQVKLADFGIARVEGSLTRTGTTVGTYAFMAPEQLEDPRAVGPAADLYSAAATAVALALGQPPFGLQDPVRRVELLAFLDPGLAAVLDRALRRDPSERWPSAKAMRDALEAVGRHENWFRSPGFFARVLTIVALGVASLAVYGLSSQPRPEAPAVALRESPPVIEDQTPPRSEPAEQETMPAEIVVEVAEERAIPTPRVRKPSVAVKIPEPEPDREDLPEPEPEVVPPSEVDVFIQSRPWSEFSIDGHPYGRAGRTVKLTPGDHLVRLVRPDGQEKTHELVVPPQGGTKFCWDFEQEAECRRGR